MPVRGQRQSGQDQSKSPPHPNPCPSHPGYRGRGRPRSKCAHCWAIYLQKMPIRTLAERFDSAIHEFEREAFNKGWVEGRRTAKYASDIEEYLRLVYGPDDPNHPSNHNGDLIDAKVPYYRTKLDRTSRTRTLK